MKLSKKAIEALKLVDTRVVAVDMDEVRKAKFKLVSDEILLILRSHMSNPLEAYMLLQFMIQGFEETYDIRGSTILQEEDMKKKGD